jgi:hypothetical protein
MSNVGFTPLKAQRFAFGATLQSLTGLTEAGVTISAGGDYGAATPGIAGDVSLEASVNNTLTITINVLRETPQIADLINYAETGVSFAFQYELGPTTVSGFAVVMNTGTLSGAKGDAARVITLAGAKVTGRLGPTGILLGQ